MTKVEKNEKIGLDLWGYIPYNPIIESEEI